MRISTVQHASFFILLAIVTASFLGLIRDFLQPLFWAAVFAILFHRLQARSVQWFRGRSSLAAVLTMVIIFLVVIIPFFFLAVAVAREAAALYENISEGKYDLGIVFRFFEKSVPPITEFMNRFGLDLEGLQQRISDAAVVVSRFLASQMVNIGQVTAGFLVDFLLMLYILFFFLRDGNTMVRVLIRVLPFGDIRERRLFAKFAEVSRVTVRGTLVVGIIQGTIGGLLFWILGIKAPVFWGVIMAVFSLLPALGTALVWIPAAIILLAQGSIWRGIILILGGVLVIGLVDNILRPILVGRSTRMPDFLVLIATLGGLTAFGISGFILGPILAALFLTVWDIFAEEYSKTTDLDGSRITLPNESPENIPPPPPSSHVK
ncbi:MAG: AI-2E family transporter [Deltaproteobacteria bacterium HGW-Deltaproteobacteria-21]|nr:MAG: AI-2E family transporter [Deltaproteobacteria bacterium HGW-Deltaproteobacteria-21]